MTAGVPDKATGVPACPDCGRAMAVGQTICQDCQTRGPEGTARLETPPKPARGEETAWARLGDYDLYDEVAHGGMGVVYRARQRRLGRTVAVKVLRGGSLAEPEARRRFRREAESAGRLQHPGVVAIHDVGEDQGVCWYSMDYVPGHNLAQRVQQRPLAAKEAAACARQVAEAIHYAHQHSVLHRDLKPSNIMMGLDDAPKVTDFGLARQLEDSTAMGTRAAALTSSGQTLGSPGYASPEQALKGMSSVRSDVYGLGAVLYHMLTGRPPFVGPTLDSVLLQLLEAEPVPPRRLNPTVPADLETICLKCLEKQPEQRYASAAAVADDLRRFEAGEPLLARPVGPWGRVVRWCRRRPAMAGLIAALLVAALGGTAGVVSQWQRAERKAAAEERQRMLAQAGERAARLRTYTAGVYAASQALISEDIGLAGDLLDRLVPEKGAEDFRGPEWYVLRERTRSQDLQVFSGHPWIVACVAASPDGKYLASGGRFVTGWAEQQSTWYVWEPATGRKVFSGPPGVGSVKSLQFSADGNRLLVSASGRTRLVTTGDWTRQTGEVSGSYACFAHAHPWLAVTEPGSGTVVLYHSDTLQELARLPQSGVQVAFSKDDRWLMVLNGEGQVRLSPVREGPIIEAPRVIPTGRRRNAAALSPDNRYLAVCGGPDVVVYDLQQPDGSPPRKLTGHRLDVKNLVFTPQGDQLVTTGSDRTVRFWETNQWQQTGLLRGHRDEVWCVEPDPQGRWITTGGKDSTVRLWPARPEEVLLTPPHYMLRPAIWASHGRKFLVAVRPNLSQVCDPVLGLIGKVLPLGGDTAAAGEGWCRFIQRPGRLEWFNDQGEITRTQVLEGDPARFQEIDSKAWSADGRVFALAMPDHKAGVWDVATGRRLALLGRPAGSRTLPMALSPDGSLLAISGSSTSVIKLITVATSHEVILKGHLARVTSLAFSPDGQQLASGSVDATLRLWKTDNGSPHAVLRGHVQDVNAVAYAPGGRTLASLGNFESVRLWNLETATEVATLPHARAGNHLAFSPDGQWLAVNLGDPAERPAPELEELWLLRTGNTPQLD